MSNAATNERFRHSQYQSMAVLVMLAASSALSILVSAIAHSREDTTTVRDVSWSVRLQARIGDGGTARLNVTESMPKLLNMADYMTLNCGAVSETYETLLDYNLRHWNRTGLIGLDKNTGAAHYIFISDNELYVRRGTDRRGLLPAFFTLLNRLRLKARLPDIMLPFNSGDNPNQQMEQGQLLGPGSTRPVLSFCTRPSYTDILFPNLLEGDVSNLNDMAKYKTHRLHRAVWRGTTDASQGWPKGRNALLQLGLERPDLIDSGVSRWNEGLMNEPLPDKRLLKEPLTFEEQIAMYKYVIWAPGNCASVRLALQLASDAAVFKIENDEIEWYYPLLKPFVHYIPLEANSTHVNLEEMMYWARHHQPEIDVIKQNANKFAHLYLSPIGRDCYTMQLMQRMLAMTVTNFSLPDLAVNVSECDALDHCPEPLLYAVEPGDESLLDDSDMPDSEAK